jgi:uncharacterized HAD superfamily protein
MIKTLRRTWLIDIDGVIFPHNGHLNIEYPHYEKALPGVKRFFRLIDKHDKLILLSSRPGRYEKITKWSLSKNNLRYDIILFHLPTGARVLVNDRKLDVPETAFSINLKRNARLEIPIKILKASKVEQIL